MAGLRRGAAVLFLASALAGCSTSKTIAEHTPASSVAATGHVDLPMLDEIKDVFPPDFPANAQSGLSTNDARRAATVGDFVSYGRSLSVEPPACGVLLKPVAALADANWIAVNSIEGADGPFVSVEADDPVAVPVAIPETGCDPFRFVADGALPDGTVRRLAAPSFDDAISYALRVDFDVTNPVATQPVLVEYVYVAILDGRTVVNLRARVPADFAAEPVLPNLLTKAIQAIRVS